MAATMSEEDVKCIEKERQALLNFKQSLFDDFGMLSTWRDDDNSRDCCNWRGVVCSNETGHVLKLRLRGSDSYTPTQYYLSGEINITSLLDLQNIEFLDLSSNDFFDSEIPKHIGSFNNMKYLNLSHSYFNGIIPSELGTLTQLRYLDLSYNYLIHGEIPHQLGNLSKLQYLDLTENKLSGAIPFHVGNLPMLQTLRLSAGYPALKINDGEWLSTLPSLTNLYLTSFPDFTHHLLPMINKLHPKLTELGLRACQLDDHDISSLFESHSNFSTSLVSLDLSFNMLTSSTFQFLSNFSTSLVVLDLSGNNLSTSTILQVISNLDSKLEELHLSDCHLSDSNFNALSPSIVNFSSSLVSLDLSSNMLTSSTFQFLSNYSLNVQELYFSDNNIVMPFPSYLNFPSLVILDLSHNNLSSTFYQVISSFGSKLEELHLSGCHISDSSFNALSPSIVNFSSSLVSLDLSNNMLTLSTFQFLSNVRFNHLQELYLSYNKFTSFPWYLSFPSLAILDLSFNNLSSSSLVFPDNSNFGPKLEVLYLQGCLLSDNSFRLTTPSIMNFSSSLVHISLSENQLRSSAIFYWLFNFTTNLHSLHLSMNLLEGPIPDDFGKKMNNLETLSMSHNKLKGEIPASLGNICTLRDLDLSDNSLSGEIPKSIGLLYQLRFLYLNGNSLEGDIVELHFSNLSNLNEFDFSDNSLSLKFDTKWDPPFQLFRLWLASCKLGPSFPRWLQTQRHLESLDISDAGINDSVPVWLWNKLQSIKTMNMSFNNLNGTIPNLPLKLSHDYPIYVLNSNQFQGSVPAFLLQAITLDLSKNKFSDLNPALCDNSKVNKMRTLDLSDNQVVGQLSDCWGNLKSLEFVDLRNNKLSGTIPPSMSTLVDLKALILRNNSFIGELPSTLQNCTYLQILDVGENLLSGSIPSWIGESFQQLKILSLRKNHFFGSLPSHLCYLRQLRVLDLSGNNLSGRISTCLKNFTAMVDKSIYLNETVNGRKLSTYLLLNHKLVQPSRFVGHCKGIKWFNLDILALYTFCSIKLFGFPHNPPISRK